MAATPSVRLRRLAMELRRLRKDSGLTQFEVTARTGVSAVALSRAEHARSVPQLRTLAALLDLYGVEGADRDALIALQRTADQRGLQSDKPGGLPGQVSAFIAFEAEAMSVLTYQGQVIPGLLQTADYARALQSYIEPLNQVEIDHHLATRLTRQAGFQARGARLEALIDEAVLRRQVGGRQVMRAQLEKLASDTANAHLTIRVVPLEVGVVVGPFTLLQFSEDPPLGYVEHMTGEILIDDDQTLSRLMGHFRMLSAASVDGAEMIGAILNDC